MCKIALHIDKRMLSSEYFLGKQLTLMASFYTFAISYYPLKQFILHNKTK